MSKLKILLAEDMDIIREDLEMTLNSQDDMEVVGSVPTGYEAQNAGDKIDVDIALLDIEMETNTAGIKVANYFQKYHPHIKVIYLTAHETTETILTAMATGAVDFIVKGCSDEVLCEHIRKAAIGEAHLESKVQSVMITEYQRLRKSEKGLNFFIENLSSLTPTERELVGYLLKHYKVKQIALARHVEVVTVKTQITMLLRKFQCRRTSKIVEMVEELNLNHLFGV